MGSRTTDRHERRSRRQRCRQDRRQTLQRATYHGNDRIRDPFLFHQAMDVGDQHDPIAGGDSEECDEADNGSNRQDPTRGKYPDDAANERQSQVDHHEKRVAHRVEG